MRKYGLAIELPILDLEKFDIVTVSDESFQIVTEYYEPFTDGSGQYSIRPKKIVNTIVVESENWTQELTDIIEQGRTDWNTNNPTNQIPAEQSLIWEMTDSFIQHKDTITDLYSRKGDFVIVPKDIYDINLEDLVRNLGLSDEQDNVIAQHFMWMVDSIPYIPTLKEFNEADGITTLSGWKKTKGIEDIFIDGDLNEYHVIEIKPLVDDLGERDALYLLGDGQSSPSFTICRTPERVIFWVQPTL